MGKWFIKSYCQKQVIPKIIEVYDIMMYLGEMMNLSLCYPLLTTDVYFYPKGIVSVKGKFQ